MKDFKAFVMKGNVQDHTSRQPAQEGIAARQPPDLSENRGFVHTTRYTLGVLRKFLNGGRSDEKFTSNATHAR